MGLAATIAGGEAGEYCVSESCVPSCLLCPCLGRIVHKVYRERFNE